MSESFTEPPSERALRIKAIESVLLEKKILAPGAVDEIVDLFENQLGPRNGAKIVARAWTDAAYKERLLANGTEAILEMGFAGLQGEYMVVLENTPAIHHVVVCTLCSCYPWPVLGLPPNWYKTAPYRSRVVIEPRAVLSEFGLDVPDDVEVRVYDSNNELRYLVLPQRPVGTEGWSEEALAEIVTRDSMIGTAVCKVPNADEGVV
ncbi:nitrile hydratase subunit alpha [Rhizobium sp. Root1204]|uniref:nitrile hydratase subunit alpha n=1 Tax=Rhizobium sp. Root1204 TaxID=1736428 RepID=UPI000715EBE9|nr:nitrile hydratase subunit alpha [Rhizobium sp. Root1204]KQV41338.1 nitrile hydratase subunit alpha [Rhizobium sp. Root1204]